MYNSRNILDFYYLEAMMDRAKRLPVVPLPSQEKWREDLNRQYEPFVWGFAASVRDYLFLICLGEARHAHEYAGGYFSQVEIGESRESAYRQAVQFSPQKNIHRLITLFNEYKWYEQGYGSTPWGNIATAIKLHGQVPDAVFIDLVVAIEHNNGNVFDKTEVSKVIAFECDIKLCGRVLEYFLNDKANLDILTHPVDRHFKWLSRETLSLLSRYYHVVSRKDAPSEIQEVLAQRPPRLPRGYESPWGNNVLGPIELSPEREDEHDEETKKAYDKYNASASATPKMPRG